MALAERKLLCKNFSKSHDPDMYLLAKMVTTQKNAI